MWLWVIYKHRNWIAMLNQGRHMYLYMLIFDLNHFGILFAIRDKDWLIGIFSIAFSACRLQKMYEFYYFIDSGYSTHFTYFTIYDTLGNFYFEWNCKLSSSIQLYVYMSQFQCFSIASCLTVSLHTSSRAVDWEFSIPKLEMVFQSQFSHNFCLK